MEYTYKEKIERLADFLKANVTEINEDQVKLSKGYDIEDYEIPLSDFIPGEDDDQEDSGRKTAKVYESIEFNRTPKENLDLFSSADDLQFFNATANTVDKDGNHKGQYEMGDDGETTLEGWLEREGLHIEKLKNLLRGLGLSFS